MSVVDVTKTTHVFLYMLVYFIGVMILMLNGFSLRDFMFEYASSLGTVGISVGVTSAGAPPIVFWAEIVGMFLRRLEILVVIYAITKIIKDLKTMGRKSGVSFNRNEFLNYDFKTKKFYENPFLPWSRLFHGREGFFILNFFRGFFWAAMTKQCPQ